MFSVILKFVFIFISILIGGVVWWNLWMYKGFIQPIPLLRRWISSSGEGYYDLILYECIISLMLTVGVIFFIFKLFNGR